MINSEVFRIFHRILADTTSNSILFSIGWMLNLQRTFGGPRTLRQQIFCLPTNIVSTTLLFVAGFTEVGVTPAEPLSDSAAELAFELDVFSAVFLTILDSATNRDRRTFSTDQLLLFEAVIVILSCLAVFHTTEVRIRALEATVVRKFV